VRPGRPGTAGRDAAALGRAADADGPRRRRRGRARPATAPPLSRGAGAPVRRRPRHLARVKTTPTADAAPPRRRDAMSGTGGAAMSLELIHREGAVRARTPGRPTADAPAMPRLCPACGPLPSDATSRYCARHLRQLRATWLARRVDARRPAA